MSGGVDSSVAAYLLGAQGFDVTGLFMKNWEEDDDEVCSAATDLADATAVARLLGFPLRTVNFATEYWDRVFMHFLAEYEAGRTPNPDVLCNREIKFREFREHAERLGATRIATGHYARTDHDHGRIRLLRARDRSKDQTYFLHALDQTALDGVLFPLGELEKATVRELARHHALPVHAKRDSTGICFIGERPFRQFLARFLHATPGPIVDQHGQAVGEHAGASLYTLGQRHGLGIGGRADDADGEPWYVYAKNMSENTLHVVRGHDHPLLFADRLEAPEPSWVAGSPPAGAFSVTARARYRSADVPCHVTIADDGAARVRFPSPQRALTPGQSVVFYDGEICLGGGAIGTVGES